MHDLRNNMAEALRLVNMQPLLLTVRTLGSLQSVMIAECAVFVLWVKQRLSIRLGNVLERLPCTFSMMGISTEMLAEDVAMDFRLRPASLDASASLLMWAAAWDS